MAKAGDLYAIFSGNSCSIQTLFRNPSAMGIATTGLHILRGGTFRNGGAPFRGRRSGGTARRRAPRGEKGAVPAAFAGTVCQRRPPPGGWLGGYDVDEPAAGGRNFAGNRPGGGRQIVSDPGGRMGPRRGRTLSLERHSVSSRPAAGGRRGSHRSIGLPESGFGRRGVVGYRLGHLAESGGAMDAGKAGTRAVGLFYGLGVDGAGVHSRRGGSGRGAVHRSVGLVLGD